MRPYSMGDGHTESEGTSTHRPYRRIGDEKPGTKWTPGDTTATKLWVSFQQTDNYDDLPVGITVWREPPDWVFPPSPPPQ